ncbi:MAG: radical SAM protein, partial [Deltaproteobacteria bacterium]|nr:radical SAM protein [Deltaproteobacteria bacterium]
AGIHTEIVHLMIPTLNDDPAETRDLIRFVRDELSPQVPVHFSRFYPQYKLRNLPPTPVSTLEAARKSALKMGLKFPYIGNVPGHPGENTVCPNCQTVLIRRVGYSIKEVNLDNGRCRRCGRPIPGLWTKPEV